ncbi:hypothetical protein SETIT_3G242700v2 [Setaria italica]|uniref:Uncharacterized protein n=1 Tax=Setaria italica TaxID=4555 RepID=A0A368QIB8_SETIT|nr:hypothetical protein SETIT_3G242700v2 [Setaria italica]
MPRPLAVAVPVPVPVRSSRSRFPSSRGVGCLVFQGSRRNFPWKTRNSLFNRHFLHHWHHRHLHYHLIPDVGTSTQQPDQRHEAIHLPLNLCLLRRPVAPPLPNRLPLMHRVILRSLLLAIALPWRVVVVLPPRRHPQLHGSTTVLRPRSGVIPLQRCFHVGILL